MNSYQMLNTWSLQCGYYTGEYRNAPHNICNLKYGIPKKISVVFHN